MYGLVGAGLGAGAVIFLQATGFFSARSEGLEGLGDAITGALAIGAVLVFAVLSGVIVAVMAGLYTSRHLSPVGAMMASASGSSIGHAVMVAVLAVILLQATSTFEADPSPSPTPSPIETPDPECVATFGPDAALCKPDAFSLPTPAVNTASAERPLAADRFVDLALGLFPAGIVGGLSGLLFARRR